jgi:hypothetical protein
MRYVPESLVIVLSLLRPRVSADTIVAPAIGFPPPPDTRPVSTVDIALVVVCDHAHRGIKLGVTESSTRMHEMPRGGFLKEDVFLDGRSTSRVNDSAWSTTPVYRDCTARAIALVEFGVLIPSCV